MEVGRKPKSFAYMEKDFGIMGFRERLNPAGRTATLNRRRRIY